MYKRILVPFDASDTATAGLRLALQFAKEQGAQVRIVHVIDDLLMISPAVYGASYDRFAEQMREAAAGVLSLAQEVAREADVAVETRLVEAAGKMVGERVMQAAKQWPADVIVCGTHGRRGLRRIVLGSDAEFMVRHTTVPILLIRHDGT